MNSFTLKILTALSIMLCSHSGHTASLAPIAGSVPALSASVVLGYPEKLIDVGHRRYATVSLNPFSLDVSFSELKAQIEDIAVKNDCPSGGEIEFLYFNLNELFTEASLESLRKQVQHQIDNNPKLRRAGATNHVTFTYYPAK